MSEDQLLQALLAAEHAAVYGYGVLGARLDEARRTVALDAAGAHRVGRDELAGLLRARAAEVPGPEPVYDVAVASPADALALAVRLEEGLAVRWRDLVGGTDDAALRAVGVRGLTGAAVRAAGWRGLQGVPATVALPGVDPSD